MSPSSVLAVSDCRFSKDAVRRNASGCLRSIRIRRRQSGLRSLARVSDYNVADVKSSSIVLADFVNPKDLPEGKNIVEYLIGETDGGLDFTFDATGVVSLVFTSSQFCAEDARG